MVAAENSTTLRAIRPKKLTSPIPIHSSCASSLRFLTSGSLSRMRLSQLNPIRITTLQRLEAEAGKAEAGKVAAAKVAAAKAGVAKAGVAKAGECGLAELMGLARLQQNAGAMLRKRSPENKGVLGQGVEIGPAYSAARTSRTEILRAFQIGTTTARVPVMATARSVTASSSQGTSAPVLRR